MKPSAIKSAQVESDLGAVAIGGWKRTAKLPRPIRFTRFFQSREQLPRTRDADGIISDSFGQLICGKMRRVGGADSQATGERATCRHKACATIHGPSVPALAQIASRILWPLIGGCQPTISGNVSREPCRGSIMGKTSIKSILAREILDSRGNPTIEVDVQLEGGAFGRAAVPSGASTGEHEAWELRDGDKKRYGGKGVLKAVANVNDSIAPALRGWDARDQAKIDNKMIETGRVVRTKRIWARTRSSVCRSRSRMLRPAAENLSLFRYLGGDEATVLPVPMMNILERRRAFRCADRFSGIHDHAEGRADFCGRASLWRGEFFTRCKVVLKDRGLSTNVGDEGGFAPQLKSADDALESIAAAVEKAGYKFGEQIFIALDPAASEFFDREQNALRFQEIRWLEADGRRTGRILRRSLRAVSDHLDRGWLRRKRLGRLEETDRRGWASKIQLVGDDLFVTNVKFLQRGIDEHVANSILIKVNQIGTLTETLAAIDLAKKNNYTAVISHRSGETEDTTIADIAVATNAGQIKTGSLCRTDRVAKYNQLLRIAEELGDKAVYGGKMR